MSRATLRKCGDSISISFQNYLKNVDFKKLLKKLNVPNVDSLIREAEHFTTREAEKRDAILLDYFGETGINRIIDLITEFLLLSPPRLRNDTKILDVGAGSGMFTMGVAKKLHLQLPKASFYALDLTPIMLKLIAEKTKEIIPFIGVAENITGSIKYARKYFKIPIKFDAVFSTLMLHHALNPEKIFENIEKVLKKNGKAIIIDLCKHDYKEFKREMGDIHQGFKPEYIRDIAKRRFRRVKVEVLDGICCESSGRAAELFTVLMKKL